MSRSTESGRGRTAAARERARAAAGAAVESAPRLDEPAVRLVAGLAALVGLGSLTATRIALNAPVTLPSVASGAWFDAVAVAAVVGPAVGALLLGVTTDEAWRRAGLVLAGVFGLLSAASASVAVPAVGATVVGGWLTLYGAVGDDRLTAGRRRRAAAVSVALLGGLTLSLFGAVGVRSGALRPAGTVLALVGMAATPLAFRPTARTLVAGGVVAAATFALTGAAPFVTGAVALAAGSVVGASAPLLAAAVGGLAATVADGAARREAAPAVAGLLLLAGGVPSSIPRALGAVLAVALVATAAVDRTEDSA
jgi:hypothetical protein